MKLYPRKEHYMTGGLAVCLDYFDDEFQTIMPYGVLTVNLSLPLSENEAFVDVNNNSSDVIKEMEERGIMKPVIYDGVAFTCRSGFVDYPLYEFDLDKIEEEGAC